jgi:hypothetical protein
LGEAVGEGQPLQALSLDEEGVGALLQCSAAVEARQELGRLHR